MAGSVGSVEDSCGGRQGQSGEHPLARGLHAEQVGPNPGATSRSLEGHRTFLVGVSAPVEGQGQDPQGVHLSACENHQWESHRDCGLSSTEEDLVGASWGRNRGTGASGLLFLVSDGGESYPHVEFDVWEVT